ncbi:hypothetical protein NDU88_001584 [Pleurodeles waltl]|uniref:Uncharacterized protein n=1 Tax=Pleurodeles waltl TaxID=8319 RepID=A0AAV7LDL8_PLEWA|nr:hypothetical protein NDU88_001584 [Pleurodeles waltl]
MDNALVFCGEGRSVKELERTCNESGKASGMKNNSATSETLSFGHWTPTQDKLHFPIRQDFLKIIRVWFSGEGAAEKTWKVRVVKTREKLGLWSLQKLMMEGKSCGTRPCQCSCIRCSSVASQAQNGQGHHKNYLLLILELQDGQSEEGVDVQDPRLGMGHCHHPEGNLHVPLFEKHSEDRRQKLSCGTLLPIANVAMPQKCRVGERFLLQLGYLMVLQVGRNISQGVWSGGCHPEPVNFEEHPTAEL